jgi:hypothetical protein
MATEPEYGELERRVGQVEREVETIAELIRIESRLNSSRYAAVTADLDLIKRRLEEMPGAVARTITELLAIEISAAPETA